MTDNTPPSSDGYILVPKEPTEAMLDAYWCQTGESKEMRDRTHAYMRRYWSAMLAATPPATPATQVALAPSTPEDVEGSVKWLRALAAYDLLARVARENVKWAKFCDAENVRFTAELRDALQRAEAAEKVLREIAEESTFSSKERIVQHARTHLAKHGGSNG